jgi:hypothetical protein
MDPVIEEIFYRFEDRLLEKGVLSGVAPVSMVGVQLRPQAYNDNGVLKYKCHIVVEVTGQEIKDKAIIKERISDTVSDYLQEQGIESELSLAGIDPQLLDWFPVSFEFVG